MFSRVQYLIMILLRTSGIVLIDKAVAARYGRILVSDHICVLTVQGSVWVQKRNCFKRSLFVVSAFLPTDGSIDMQQYGFYGGFSILVCRSYLLLFLHKLEKLVQ